MSRSIVSTFHVETMCCRYFGRTRSGFLFLSKFVTLSVLNLVVTSIWNQDGRQNVFSTKQMVAELVMILVLHVPSILVQVNTDKFLCEHLFLSISLCSKVNRKVTCINPRDWKYTTWDALWDSTNRTWSKFLPPATKLGQGYVFTRVCDSVQGGGTVESQHALQVVSQYALQQVSKGGRVVSQHALQVSRPTPRGEVEGSGQGGLQAHTLAGSPGPHPGRHIPACTEAGPPKGHCCGQYASYWNAFLYRVKLVAFKSVKLYYIA